MDDIDAYIAENEGGAVENDFTPRAVIVGLVVG